MLIEGLFWHIGDGKRVKIWGDKWIPQPTTFTIQSPCSVLRVDATIDEIIDPIVGGWNVPPIHYIFHEEEAKLICNLPLSLGIINTTK